MMRVSAVSSSTRRNDENLPTGNEKMFVIDTVSYKCDWLLRYESHNDWRFTWKRKDLPTGEDEETTPVPRAFEAYHRLLGIYIAGENGRIKFVSVSLPRLIHHNNSVLIQSQEQLDEALGTLRNVIEEIADTSAPLLYFTRVDLVWQFQHCPAALIRAHQHCVFPRCRVKKKVYDEGRSASWEYSDKRIIIYDKRLRDQHAPGNVVRVEIQLHREPLRKCLAGGEGQVIELDFAKCYQAFRSLLTTFAPSQQVTNPQNKFEALAVVERQAQAAGIDSPVALLLSTMKPRTAREWRKRITAAQLRQEDFRWEDVLPESSPPDPIPGY